MMPEDLKELLRAFNDHGVEYLIVGGYAFGVHAEPRATKDLDIFIRSDEKNSKAVFCALAQYGAPLQDLTPSDFMDGTTFQIGQSRHGSTFCSTLTVLPSRRRGGTESKDLLMAKSKPPLSRETTSSEINWRVDGSKTFWMLRRCVLPVKNDVHSLQMKAGPWRQVTSFSSEHKTSKNSRLTFLICIYQRKSAAKGFSSPSSPPGSAPHPDSPSN
jgi:hypothetical protein